MRKNVFSKLRRSANRALLFLARGGHLDLLQLTGDRLLVPTPVALEIRRRGSEDVTVRVLDATPWLEIVDPPPVPSVIHAWDLGPGESAVLAWARAHPGCKAIIDDLVARRCAATLGVPVRGTLGLVLLAKKRGRIPLARPVLEALRQAGMYLSDRVVNGALALVGE
jgi:predicted nucleic acid-binding protein